MPDTEKEALCTRIDELCVEVELLRQERDEWRRVAESKQDIIDHMRDARGENAKLRELISVMAYCNQFRRDCDGCRMNGEAGTITERAGCDELLDRLRELGVEVD